ncbi:MAG: QueT transporter family protein [Bacillus sp. (in: Bacteria)]|nr:QueT transporter family protein [Bacillus sp. (in: firmicutes)]
MKMQNSQTVPARIVHSHALFTAQAAMIAAIYIVLTLIANAFGLANHVIQVRISEALTILPYFTPAAIPGLVVGCFISNILTGCILPDIIFGSLATLIGALGTYALRKWKWCAPVTPILANTLIVPLVLIYGYGLLPEGFSTAYCYGYYALTVGIGEFISCGILGMIHLFTLEKYADKIFFKL